MKQTDVSIISINHSNDWRPTFAKCWGILGVSCSWTSPRLVFQKLKAGRQADSLQLIDYNNWITWWRSDSCASAASVCAGVTVTRTLRKSKENPRVRLALRSTRFHLQNIGVTTCNRVIIMYSPPGRRLRYRTLNVVSTWRVLFANRGLSVRFYVYIFAKENLDVKVSFEYEFD